MSEWKKTSCVLCYQNCGLEVTTEGSRIIQVRADRDNPRSQGYVCRKGANIAYFQNNPERLRFPLKRIGDRFAATPLHRYIPCRIRKAKG